MNSKALYAVIDLKSFYASCECASRGLDIFSTPLVVLDPTRGPSTVCMSTTPYLKENYRIPNVCRKRDIPNIPGIIYAQPRMAYYIEMSSRVVSIFLDFVSEEDLHVYSIDESFLNIGPYLSLAGQTPEEFVMAIQKRIKDELGLIATAGIAPNMFLAKIALDNEGKKRPPFLARWTEKDIETKLWKISPITKIWGISHGSESHLSRIGIRSMEELAKADERLLKREFGIMGKQLHDLANGIDPTDIRKKYIPKETSLSTAQTLKKNYRAKGAKIILREMVDDLALRLRLSQKKCGGVGVFAGYSADVGGGFAHQMTLLFPTDDNEILFQAICEVFDKYYDGGPIRNLGISFFKLGHYSFNQLSIFESGEEMEERHNLHVTIDEIWALYGKNSCLRATSLLKDSTIRERHQEIGGHKA
ncbi:MAG: damage repair protein [Bacilli bacterium]|nr:damage repair protein [Bacilli bacterium]